MGLKEETDITGDEKLATNNERQLLKDVNDKSNKTRNRRKPKLFKLKFHHQALPPEYLDHYEASLRQERLKQNSWAPPEQFREVHSSPTEFSTTNLSSDKGLTKSDLKEGLRNDKRKTQRKLRPVTIHEAGGGSTQELIRDLILSNPHLQQVALQQAAIARAHSVPSVMKATQPNNLNRVSFQNGSLPIPSPDVLDKEERMSVTSNASQENFSNRKRKPKLKRESPRPLMGRCLGSAGLGNFGTNLDVFKSPDFPPNSLNLNENTNPNTLYNYDQREPLNLCVRDEMTMHHLTPYGNITIKKEIIEDPSENVYNPHTSYPYSNYLMPNPWNTESNNLYPVPHWINDYRLKTEDGLSSGQSTPSLCSQSSHLPCNSPTWSVFSPPSLINSPQPQSPGPQLSPLVISNTPTNKCSFRYSPNMRDSSADNERSQEIAADKNTIRPTLRHSKNGARRKKIPLFIPTGESAEMSMCKFKFTGGAKPTLEEKKMVSVDSVGNLRYFSKGERTVCQELCNSPNITGKIFENLSKSEQEVKKIRLESDTDDNYSLSGSRIEASCSSATTSPTATLEYGVNMPFKQHQLYTVEESPKRKRRSKKSSVREKLEQTLRDKGLLIQTQQVESAEGATYCKFRQLRKITRYLFRSWKDYLPGQHPDSHSNNYHPESSLPPQGINSNTSRNSHKT